MKKHHAPFKLLLCLLFCNINIALASTNARQTKTKEKPRLEVKIRGIKDNLLTNTKTNLKNKAELIQYRLTAKNVRRYYHESISTIHLSISPYGYFHPKIQKTISKDGKNWLITYNITKGDPVKITSINLKITGEGAKTKTFRKLRKRLPIKVGENFNADNYSKAKTEIFDRAINLGYFNAEMKTAQIIIDKARNSAKIILHFTTGKRYAFGKTAFNKTPYDESFLRRFILYKQNEPFKQNKLIDTQKAFQSTPYFQQVTVKPEVHQLQNRQAPIDITLIPQKSRIYTIGAGYGTDIGPRGVAGVQFLRATKTGHRFDMKISGSPRYSYFLSHYIIPGKNPATDQYTLSLGTSHENISAGKSTSTNISANYDTTIHGIQQKLGLTFLYEKYKLTDSDNKLLQQTDANVLYPNISWRKTKANDPIRVRRGYRLGLSLSGAVKNIGSKTSFFQMTFNDKFITPLGKRTRFIFRNTLGYTGIDNIYSLPLSLQLLAGGANSLRGFTYDSIGPGNYLTVNSVELQEKLFGNIYAAAFCDTGNVTMNHFPKKLQTGVGGGLVWLSPIGAIEVSLTQAITENKKPWMVQFSMGPEL